MAVEVTTTGASTAQTDRMLVFFSRYSAFPLTIPVYPILRASTQERAEPGSAESAVVRLDPSDRGKDLPR
ncbi:hypothetical protein GCM10011575_38810 [Microlunatus endophyticus]|uniref:Uncharacterized protein n=1 Tax=Microlunatus endophyticus TaxID=1716077 RepID=A0A917W8I2_9ACTN|nr:hypothetical protein GCM10011575_38810 [Microlunatus endophyticus]